MQKNQAKPPLFSLDLSPEQERDEAVFCTLEKRASVHLHAGDLCPKCYVEKLDYDGLLNLSCPKCGSISGSSFT